MGKTGIAAFIAVICSFLGIYDYGEEQITEAYALMEQEDYTAAEEQFQAALQQMEAEAEEHPDEEVEQYVSTEAYRGLGMIAYETQDYPACIEYLQMALNEGVEATPVIYNLMGLSAMYQEDYEGALAAFGQGVALQGAGASGTSQDAEEASGESAGTAVSDTEFAEVYREMHFNEIVCYEKLLDWENAELQAEEYVTLYPDDEVVQKEYTFLKTR